MHTNEIVASAADRLESAAAHSQPCTPVRDLLGESDIATAYAVQQLSTERRLAMGASIVGRKIGLTSAAVQRQLGVRQPDFGVLFNDMDATAMQVVPSRQLLQPKVEAEIAFLLGSDLVDGPLDLAQVRAAVSGAAPALEIVDSRIENWDICITDTVADNASGGMYVLGDVWHGLDTFEPREETMRMFAADELVAEGNGEACLGDPLLALVWLARAARDYGRPLQVGQVVLSGALGPMVPATPGGTLRADFSSLGTVTATFSDKEQQ